MHLFFVCFHFGLPVAVSPVEMHRLVREPKRAHPRLGDSSAALPGVADGKPHAAVSQPPAVTLVVFLETPGGVKMADQRQLGSLTSACLYRLVEGERPRYVGDGACRKKKIKSSLSYFSGCSGNKHGPSIFPTEELSHHVSPTDVIVLCQPTISPTLTLRVQS